MAGFADPPTMKNHAVAQHAPSLPREQGHEVFFDPQRGGCRGQAKSRGEPRHVGVDDDADIDVKGISEDDIRCFSSDPRKRHQCVKVLWDRASMLLHQLL